jgi:phosphoribosylformylglycinamidine (FGAM) synthase PurS component
MMVGIKVMPREAILDSQGRAIEESMKNNGYQFDHIRAGKFFEVSFLSNDQEVVRKEAEKMLKDGGLFNPLIEKFEIVF